MIGAGPNGLVAANLLADAGWTVAVLEAQPEPGGAVRSHELTLPGFVHDTFSSFYPFGAASPVLRALELGHYGLEWSHAPLAIAHPTPDGRAAVVSRDLDETAASLDRYHPGDGAGWRQLYGLWERTGDALLDALLQPFPPVRAGLALAAAIGPSEWLRFARHLLVPVRRLAEEHFTGEGGGLLLAGNALHADLAPEAAGSGLMGWLLMSLAQQVGYPVARGGAGRLTAALVARLDDRGGAVHCSEQVTGIEVRAGRAAAVRTARGDVVPARRAVLADVTAPRLYLDLVGPDHLPARTVDDLGRFQFDSPTIKVDWALRGPIPWIASAAARAGTVHLIDSLDDLTQAMADLAMGVLSQRPFLVLGQMTTADATRSPAGTEVAWAYTHVPRCVRGDRHGQLAGTWSRGELDVFADRMEREVERRAPGFRSCIVDRHILGPADLEAMDANLVSGAINGGTAQLHQQLVFRPLPGRGGARTPIAGLFLASASAHPGGGVHGGPGANAARAALGLLPWAWRRSRPVR